MVKKINEKLQDILMEMQGKRIIQANWLAALIDKEFIFAWTHSFSGEKVKKDLFKGIKNKVKKIIYNGNDRVFKATWIDIWKKSVKVIPKKLFLFPKFLKEEDELKPIQNRPNDPLPEINEIPRIVPEDLNFAEILYDPPIQEEIDALNLKSEWDEFLNVGIREDEIINRISVGVIEGLDIIEISNSIFSLVRGSRRSATSVARTEILRMNNAAQEQSCRSLFKNLLKGWKYLATLDLRTRPQHGELDGRLFKDNEPRPLLPDGENCRCNYVPVLKSWKELGLPQLDTVLSKKERASMDGQVPQSLKYSSWFDKQSAERKRKILGNEKYENLMTKNGAVHWSDFVKLRNSPAKIQPIATVKGDRIKKGSIVVGRQLRNG